MAKQRTETLGPWPDGIVNSRKDYRLPKGACLDALNMDFSMEGCPSTRGGFVLSDAVTDGHSLSKQGDRVFFVDNGTLGIVTAIDPLAMTTVRTGLSTDPISYAERGGEVWWSNGTDSGRCNSDNSDHPWTVPAPSDITLVSAGAGTLPAGKYRIAITHAMTDGEESHASTIESFTLSSAGSIDVTMPTATAGTDYFNVYCTIADGTILQRYSQVSAATGSVSITAKPAGRQIRDRAFLRPLPAGDAICFLGGRLLSLKGQFLYYSQPYDYGLYNPDEDFIVLGADGSILAPVETGVFVSADKTWFYAGTDIANAEPIEKLPCGAASGTVFNLPKNSNAVGWYSDQGIVIGLSDGSVTLPQLAKGFIAPIADSGSVWVRQKDGESHVVMSLVGAAYDWQVSDDFTTAKARYSADASTLAMNIVNHATSRYANFSFNSFANFGGSEYGCDVNGLTLLEGDDDDGTEIVSVIDLGRVGYGTQQIKSPGTQQIKSPECVYVTGKSSIPLDVVIYTDKGIDYTYPARTYSEVPKTIRHDGMKGLMNERMAWFSTVIRGYGLAEIYACQVLVNESNRKI